MYCLEDSAGYIGCKGDSKVGRRNGFLQEVVRGKSSGRRKEGNRTGKEENKTGDRKNNKKKPLSLRKEVCLFFSTTLPPVPSLCDLMNQVPAYEQHIFAVVTVRPVQDPNCLRQCESFSVE